MKKPRTYAQRLQHRLVAPQYTVSESWPYGKEKAMQLLYLHLMKKEVITRQKLFFYQVARNRQLYSGVLYDD